MRRFTALPLAIAVVLAACGGGTTPTTDPGTEVETVPHRVLADGLKGGGQPWTTALVDSQTDLDQLVPDAGVDWGDEVVFRFTLAESSTCPFDEMQGLEYSQPDLRLYPVVPLVGEPEVCTDDANPHTIVVAVARETLPEGEFSIWIEGEDPPSGVTDGVTRFAAGELTQPRSSEIEPLNSEGDLPLGEKRVAYDVTTHCGLDIIYRVIDGRQWEMAEKGGDQIDFIPPEWKPQVDGEQIDLIVERTEADLLLVTAAGSETVLTYMPTEEFVGCD